MDNKEASPMNDLVEEFKRLKTPQRVSLISDFHMIHTNMLKNFEKSPKREETFHIIITKIPYFFI